MATVLLGKRNPAADQGLTAGLIEDARAGATNDQFAGGELSRGAQGVRARFTLVAGKKQQGVR